MTLNEYLDQNGILRKDFAEACGISRQALHKLLRGEYAPKLKTAFAIQRVTCGKFKAAEMIRK